MSKKKILIFTGAGVDKESGIETFRDSNDGLWNNHRIEDVATIDGWNKDKERVLNFYNERRSQLKEVVPNSAHKLIASLEDHFDVTIVTQNVSDLHKRAGSTKVIHLHGELTKARGCLYNNKISNLDNIVDIGYNDINIGDKCPISGSQLRPHICWFGEQLDSHNLSESKKAAEEANVCIVIGTSMQVSPANTIPFLTPDNALIYYIDPSDFNGHLTAYRRAFFYHIKDIASVGMKNVYDDLLKIFKINL